MAATIKILNEEQHKIIREILSSNGEGVILVNPEIAEELAERVNLTTEELDGVVLDDYDFGGDADIWVDRALCMESYATDEIICSLVGGED